MMVKQAAVIVTLALVLAGCGIDGAPSRPSSSDLGTPPATTAFDK